jgi:hypothetical protein
LGFQEYCKIGHYVWLSERAEQGVGEQVANLL